MHSCRGRGYLSRLTTSYTQKAHDTGGQGLLQYWLALQLEAYIETGQFEEGWTVLKEALTIRPKYGDRYWEEEVYRLNGELLLARARRNSGWHGG
jgi:hypothetical protein